MADIEYTVNVNPTQFAPAPGPPGPSGASAYTIAVVHGFVGSEAAWLASLHGSPGPTGQTGNTGSPGPAGPLGSPGISSYTNAQGGFNIPAVGSTVQVAVTNASWIVPGEMVYVAGAGTGGQAGILQVTNVVGNLVTLLNPPPPTGATQGVPEAPTDGQQYGRQSAAWTVVVPNPVASSTTPVMDGIAAVGSGTTWAKADHVHPSDTSRITDAPSDGNLYARKNAAWSIVPAASGPGQGYWDPITNGVYFSDDFNQNSLSSAYGSYTAGGLMGIYNSSTYGSDTTKKINGCSETSTGTTSGTNQGGALVYGMSGTATGSIVYGLGPLTTKARMFWETALPVTAINYRFRFGIAQMTGTNYLTTAPIQGFFFEFVPDQNGGKWRVGVGAASITYTNTSVAPLADTANDLQIDINAAWTQITFTINGTVAATISSGIPTTKGNLFNVHARDTGTTNYFMALDAWSLYYPFAR